jgi:Tfp pilus assembly protein PilX
MKNIKEKGFALILSLVLLLAMSLMGGSLILITSEDHRSNNLVDIEQQAFHVAEMALQEGEMFLTNQYQGPLEWDAGTQTAIRNLALRNLPINLNTPFIGTMAPSTNGIICINSFRNLPNNLQVIDLDPATAATSEGLSFNFGTFLANSSIPTEFRGAGSSAKRGSGGSGSGMNGMAFRVYGCGIYNPDQNAENQTIVTLESVVILPTS